MHVCAVKNKSWVFHFRKAEFELLYMEGIDIIGTTLDEAVERKYKKDRQYSFFGAEDKWKLGVGREASKQFLKDNPKNIRRNK